MNADQKKRATELLSAWRATAYALHGDRMAALLQELVDAPEAEPVLVVEVEPGYWSRGSYYEGSKPHIDPTKVWNLPIGTNLYTAPPAAPSAPEVLTATNPAQISSSAEPSTDVVRDAERLDWLLRKLPGVVLRYCVGVLSDTSDGKEFRDAIDAARKRQGGAIEREILGGGDD